MRYQLKIVDRPDRWRVMHDIRRAVLFAPGRHPIAYDENHPADRTEGSTPFLFCENDEAVGVVRLDAHGEIGIVRLVAIVADRQRTGLGRAMDALLVAEARRRGIRLLRVNAAADAVGLREDRLARARLEPCRADGHGTQCRADAEGDRRLVRPMFVLA
jgi:GNAT superfamily N-acetyltransferase